ncbi:hypothetical protein QR680_013873 [Steinernema hermaphroditum]|uniref:Major facilitator superfamily (MFS) profile domain-containing protein n=1 Tax=Steinernema hermaphroditum TaxID=289476 RepID=A0AA39I6Z2_9BILA|nr:hypothetical protein QR680_013873 [Steinernema hermaphroditum]
MDRLDSLSCLPRNKYVTMAVLILSNLLNYMDRFTVAGVLTDLQKYFAMNNSQSGLLQTIFIVFYMVFAPLCGFLGDRYNRKLIMSVGLFVWIAAVAASTFVGRDHYYIFLLCRGLVGVGEASYSTIAPTIIADIFTGRARSTWLTVFYLMIPVGSGLGFALGANVATLANNQWQWGVRVTPILGVIVLLMVIFFMENPERGAAEHAKHEVTSLKEDLLYLFYHKTFICTTLGLTSVIFATGALSWWTPTLFEYAIKADFGKVSDEEKITIALTFGAITAVAGIVGVVLGTTLAGLWREGKLFCKASRRSHAYICAIGAIGGMPFLFATLMLCRIEVVRWVMIFFAVTFMCFNWAANMDILLMVIVANRRALANSIQTLISHALGDAASPYLVGMIADATNRNSTGEPDVENFVSLRNALFLPNALLVLGIGGYLAASFFVEGDSHEVEEHRVDVGEEDETRAIMSDAEEIYGAISNDAHM